MRTRAAVLLVAAAAVASCSRGRGDPRATFETIRAAAATRDPKLLAELHCNDGRAEARQKVRELRARLERKDPPEQVLDKTGLTLEDVTTGTIDETAMRMMARYSPLSTESRWYENAQLVAVEPEHEDTALLRLRGTDGTERTLWLVREAGIWNVDGMRSWGLAK